MIDYWRLRICINKIKITDYIGITGQAYEITAMLRAPRYNYSRLTHMVFVLFYIIFATNVMCMVCNENFGPPAKSGLILAAKVPLPILVPHEI